MSTVISRDIEHRGIYGTRITVHCSCGLSTIQRAMDRDADFCGRCGYLNDRPGGYRGQAANA
jgi:hypothetical protein